MIALALSRSVVLFFIEKFEIERKDVTGFGQRKRKCNRFKKIRWIKFLNQVATT